MQFVTFRLADAFPCELRGEWEELLEIEDDRRRRRELEEYLDAGRGECHLKRSEVAGLVEGALGFFDRRRYELDAWVVMPNHVHVLFVQSSRSLSAIVRVWKSHTAREANRALGRAGRFWAPDYWDTYMRDGEHALRVRRYIENNPVKARLVLDPCGWPWSSARRRDEYGRLAAPER
jgi:REP element-mobilizing transposase RayT